MRLEKKTRKLIATQPSPARWWPPWLRDYIYTDVVRHAPHHISPSPFFTSAMIELHPLIIYVIFSIRPRSEKSTESPHSQIVRIHKPFSNSDSPAETSLWNDYPLFMNAGGTEHGERHEQKLLGVWSGPYRPSEGTLELQDQ